VRNQKQSVGYSIWIDHCVSKEWVTMREVSSVYAEEGAGLSDEEGRKVG